VPGVASAERQIENLLYRYAECVDDGDFDGVSTLFAHADYHLSNPGAGRTRGDSVGATMRASVQTYDGSPRTKHVMTNAIIEVDEATNTASARSYFTVLQATEGLTLQPIITGRYADRFECVDGAWRFADRSITIEQFGELSAHLRPGFL
jgi:3-phenylpropionate/cinnamic acid dioxygenase small subunit